ncbi:MAG TPA: site-specific integrase [Chitinophagaceae bacterium]|nr:site-specific integrase [Chitinophagaceae bacterium]
MTQEKKFFTPILRTYKEDISKRWRVEYWSPTHNGQRAERVVLYGNINKGKTAAERHRIAKELISGLGLGEARREKNILEKVIEINSIHWRKKTVSTYNTVSSIFQKFLGSTTPEQATLETINKFLLWLHRQQKGGNTIEKYRKLLYTLYAYAQSQKLCTDNPVQLVKRQKAQHTSLQFFSDQQIDAFKGANIDEQLWLGIRLLFYCFIRPGEQRLLKISDINLEYGFIELRAEISKNRKTQKVSIPYTFLQELQFLRDYPNDFYILSKSGRPGQVPVSTKWLNNEHAKVLDTLKIRGRYAFYSWKHTGAVKAVRNGINLKDLQMQLRHHSLDMVNEYLKNLGVMMSEDLRTKYPVL